MAPLSNNSNDSPALSIRGLTKSYGEHMHALKGIDLEVMPGDFFALLGPNGAGKSTTIGIICSLVRKTAGAVEVFGHNIDSHFSAAKQCIGVVPQEFNFNVFEKVEDIVVNQAGYYGLPRKEAKARTEQTLKQLGLWDKRHVQSRGLSGGMKRRLFTNLDYLFWTSQQQALILSFAALCGHFWRKLTQQAPRS